MQFIPPTTSKVDDTATLSDPTADDPPAVNTVDVSPEPSGPHPREVKVGDPNLIPMTNNPPGSNIEVTTYLLMILVWRPQLTRRNIVLVGIFVAIRSM